MLAFMKDIKDIELIGLTNPQDIQRAKDIFKELLSMIKYMGKFFAVLLLYIYTGIKDAKFKTDYHTLSLIMTTMMVPTYIFERYSFFLAQVLTMDDQNAWFNWRKEVVKHKIVCHDLIYLKKFIAVEEKRNLIRKNTMRRMSSARIIPKSEIDYHVNRLKMDINEFLSHLQLQVNLELDDIFSSDLQAIIEYFKVLDDYINRTFPNAELEIKIDLMRLILRVTSSTKFVNYIYVLSNMNVDFLNECQIFALFCQVLLTELKKPKQDQLLKEKELEVSRIAAQSTSPLKRKPSMADSRGGGDDSSCYRATFELPDSSSLDKLPKLSPLRLSCEPEPSRAGDSIRRSNIDDSMGRSPVYAGKLVPPPLSIFSPKIKQHKDSIRSSDSSEIDLEPDSPELSESSPKRHEKVSAFQKYKQRNSLNNRPKVLKRLGHIDPYSSQELKSVHTDEVVLDEQIEDEQTKSDDDESNVAEEPDISPFKDGEGTADELEEEEGEEVPRIDFLKKQL